MEQRQILRVGVYFFIALCIYVLLYTIFAYQVLDNIYADEDGLWWRTSPAGTLFPIPSSPGILQTLSRVSRLDALVYSLLIENRLIFIIDAVMITATLVTISTVKRRGIEIESRFLILLSAYLLLALVFLLYTCS